MSQVGTPLFAAPEVLSGEKYDQSADAYSFGVLLRECLTGVPPTHSLQDYISKNSSLFACCMSAGASVGPKRQFKSINELPEGESGL